MAMSVATECGFGNDNPLLPYREERTCAHRASVTCSWASEWGCLGNFNGTLNDCSE